MKTKDMYDLQSGPHLNEGQVATLRDEGLSDPWASSHADACDACAAELADSRARATALTSALLTLDEPVDVAAAKAAVRRRLDRARSEPRRQTRIPLGRAAAILLVTAGAAAALPWSPLARWRSAAPPEPTAIPAPPTQATAAAEMETSITVDVGDRIDVIVTGATTGSALEVMWRNAAEALVAAPRGSTFALATSRVEVGATDGTVRVEIPRGAMASVVVNGRTYLERSTQGLTLIEPAAEVSDQRVRFLVREP